MADRRLVRIYLDGGMIVDTTLSTRELEGALMATVMEGKPAMKIPLIAGEATVFIPHIAGWQPKPHDFPVIEDVRV